MQGALRAERMALSWMKPGTWRVASCIAARLLAPSWSFGKESTKAPQARSAGLQLTAAASRAPQRAIAVVLDASRNMSPQCFEDLNTAKYVTSSTSPDGLFVGSAARGECQDRHVLGRVFRRRGVWCTRR